MLTRTLFLKMAESAALRSLVEARGWPFAQRFVAGRTLDEAVEAVRALNARGVSATLSHLGEHVTDTGRAKADTHGFQAALARLHGENLRCGISVKPSQVGMQIDPCLAEANVHAIVETAAAQRQFVRLDMEDSSTTDATLALLRSVHAEYTNAGCVIQAYLRRSRGDVNALNDQGISVRLCKGAYNEPPSVAFPSKAEVDENFYLLMKMLLHSGHRPAIATHDPAMIEAAIRIAEDELPKVNAVVPRPNADKRQWEFQMLYGIRRDLQSSLAARGYNVRVYVPYGTEWYPYFMRRLAERPANIAFVLKSLKYG